MLDSALAQFPIIGTQLGRPEGLQGSVGAIVFGALGALYGAVGLGLALQNVQATAWAVPRNSRTHPVLTRVTSVFLLATAGTHHPRHLGALGGGHRDRAGRLDVATTRGSTGWCGWSPSSSSAP